eukprot:gnl/TRDRNA2_/TRDRNA2_80314_c0_seq1.p1 gnl/TRDRNA2_/TRDRNA2_80314_c0~~gnl/TRDRNA2_/TRDRNA2_80314_c0_seq1.p1  ORF type:complete len:477 (-),score=84.78 gnl/TRDRNA2_/TRDRNA2_80314_c0_seq1:108-1481(-)
MPPETRDSELNARQRKHVYMHSTIFDEGGPTARSVYAPNRQEELYAKIRPNTVKVGRPPPPDMTLASPADVRCTQNQGHGVVIPDSSYQHGYPMPIGETPRKSGPEALVGDDHDVLRVVKANRDNDNAIPREFKQTSINLQWHDQRNEISRTRCQPQDTTAAEKKRMDMSSEIFGKERMIQASTGAAKQELRSEQCDSLGMDSVLDRRDLGHKYEGRPAPELEDAVRAHHRHAKNLAGTLGEQHPDRLPAEPQEDPNNFDRRRTEKNYSELFGSQMGQRQDIRSTCGREELHGTRTCSFLDSRSEIAVRNKDRWRGDRAHEATAADEGKSVRLDNMRKEAELESELFDRRAPEKLHPDTEVQQLLNNERTCWDTSDGLQSGAEIARRSRLKEYQDGLQSAQHRRRNDFSSNQVGGTVQGLAHVPVDPPSPSGNKKRLDRPLTAKDTKLASLQSSLFS